MNHHLKVAAEKKDSKKNGAARKDFVPSYFVTALTKVMSYDNAMQQGKSRFITTLNFNLDEVLLIADFFLFFLALYFIKPCHK